MRRRLRLLLSALASVAALAAGTLAARPSAACSPPACWPASASPADGATVPANLPALLYLPARNLVDPQPPSSDGFTLTSADGSAVPITFEAVAGGGRGFHVRPAQPLAPGRHLLRYPDGCAGTPPGPTTRMHAFTAAPSVPLPTAIGSARVTGHRIETIRVGTVSGSCTTEITAAVALIAVTPTPELRAYLALAHVNATVGNKSPVALYREPTTSDGAIEIGVYAGCVVPDPGADSGLAPGRHRVELGASVIGVAQPLPPLSLEVELTCAGGSDAGAPERPDAALEVAPPDVSVPDSAPPDAPAAAPAPPARGGCSVAREPPPAGLLLFALLAVVRARRRRP